MSLHDLVLETQVKGSSDQVSIPDHISIPDRISIPERIDELDGIRGLAAVMVVLHHLSQSFPPGSGPRLLRSWLAVTHAGWIGVDIFFALSGFLITRTLLHTRKRPHYYRNFYARRVLRLLPPYLLTLGLVFVFVPHSGAFLLLSLVYLANFADFFHMFMVYGPLWSLSVEEHFYLIWPWLVRFLRPRAMFFAAMAVAIASPIARALAQRYGVFDPYYSWFRFDGLSWGAMLAVLVNLPGVTRRQVRLWSLALAGAGSALFVLGALHGTMSRASVLGSSVVFGLVAMATTGFIGLAALGDHRQLLAPLRTPVLRFFGDISYWLYLIHTLVLDYALKLLPAGRSVTERYGEVFVLVFGVSILSGVLVRRGVEMPALRLKARFR